MTTTGALDAARAVIESFAAGDRQAIGAALGRDYFTYRPRPDEPTAAEVIGAVIDDVVAAFPDLQLRILEADETEDGSARLKVAVSGTNIGGLWGAPGTGRPLAFDVDVRVREVEGGLAINIDGLAMPAIAGMLREVELMNAPDAMHLPARHPDAQVPEVILRLVFNGQIEDKPCGHLGAARFTEAEHVTCDDCASGDIYPTARLCLVCGHVGCCDTSVEKHAKAHFTATGHPLIRSLNGTERWIWCYEDGILLGGATLDRLAAQLGS